MGLFNTIRMGSSAAGDYEVERSLRFNRPDTTHLTRTLGSTSNRRTFTYSFWIKRTVQMTNKTSYITVPPHQPLMVKLGLNIKEVIYMNLIFIVMMVVNNSN